MNNEMLAGFALVVMLAFYFLLLCAAIAMYVLGGIGMMKMAKSCGLKHTWMAFLPFASTYQMGKIAECNTQPGKKALPLRHFALIGQIVITVLGIGYYVWYAMQVISISASGEVFSPFDVFTMLGGALGFVALIWLLSASFSVLIYYIYWKIFRLFAPQNAVLFLLLSILLGAQPILVFIIRNHVPQFPVRLPPDGDWT